MERTFGCNASRALEYFKRICAIPHGSGDMERIADFCMGFAKEQGLRALRDEANNVIIFKDGTVGYENKPPIILQGHLDMVCQKTEESAVDFAKDPIEIVEEGGYLKAVGTTLGADNGIAVAMIMSVLADKELSHPPIEAVFTTDEEIGMIGAERLDASVLKGKMMINLDSEEADTLTVSCAGGSDFKAALAIDRQKKRLSKLTVAIKALKGGHSGVEINAGRVNANLLMGRLINNAADKFDFDIIAINGGTKGNAIPTSCTAELATSSPNELKRHLEGYFATIKEEIKERENNCKLEVGIQEAGEWEVMDPASRDRLLYLMLMTPNGVVDMSCEIEGLVETSLNMGVLSTAFDSVNMHYSLRSNKKTALDFLEDKMTALMSYHGCTTQISGRYQPWEYKENSPLQRAYVEEYRLKFGQAPKVCAIHAGLECAVFARKIEGLDCISIGPDMEGVHTVNERLKISSVYDIYEILCNLIKKC